jgi:hypothetical protein
MNIAILWAWVLSATKSSSLAVCVLKLVSIAVLLLAGGALLFGGAVDLFLCCVGLPPSMWAGDTVFHDE